MVDWQQIEKDFISWRMSEETKSMLTMDILNWFKNRIESAQIVPTIEDKIEYENINVTADIKVNYGK
jgi:hypothetical protein